MLDVGVRSVAVDTVCSICSHSNLFKFVEAHGSRETLVVAGRRPEWSCCKKERDHQMTL